MLRDYQANLFLVKCIFLQTHTCQQNLVMAALNIWSFPACMQWSIQVDAAKGTEQNGKEFHINCIPIMYAFNK